MSFDEEYRDEHDECRNEIESLRAQLAQAEINAALYQDDLAEVTKERDEESRQADHWGKAHGEMMERRNEVLQQLIATQAHVARLEYALSQWQEGSLNEPHLSLCYRLTDEALSTPINLDALHEDRARECERLAGDGHLSIEGTAWLIEEAAAHRAKKEDA